MVAAASASAAKGQPVQAGVARTGTPLRRRSYSHTRARGWDAANSLLFSPRPVKKVAIKGRDRWNSRIPPWGSRRDGMVGSAVAEREAVASPQAALRLSACHPSSLVWYDAMNGKVDHYALTHRPQAIASSICLTGVARVADGIGSGEEGPAGSDGGQGVPHAALVGVGLPALCVDAVGERAGPGGAYVQGTINRLALI